nr:transporter substrate-binding domain-containing protein [Loigolactobacillus iwatensis]
MKKIWKLAQVALVGLLVAAGVSYATTPTQAASLSNAAKKELNQKGTLKIGLEGTFQPYSYSDKGKLTGYEVELGRDLAKQMGLKPVFVQTQFDSLIAGLNGSKYDIILNNMAKNPTRTAKYNFTSPYIYGKSEIAVKKSNKSIKKAKDIKGKKMAQTASSNNATDAQRLGATIVSSSGFEQSIELVEQGRADGTINSVDAFGAYLKQKPKANIKLIKADSSIKTQQIGGMLNKKDKNLTKATNKALKTLRKNGTLKKLSVKYFGQDVTKK